MDITDKEMDAAAIMEEDGMSIEQIGVQLAVYRRIGTDPVVGARHLVKLRRAVRSA